MLIDNVEAFKSWLTRNLAPICDADPAALARYVVALVKKDKAESELREICADQLEVFLQEKTKDFVNTLFSTLADKTYVSLADSSSAISGTSGLQISNSGPTDTTKPDIPRRTTEESGQENREPGNRRTRNSPSRSPVRPDVIIRDDKRRRPDDARRRLEPERRGYRGRDFPARRRSPGRSRSRSGSRSRNRSRGRSRSRSFSRSRSRSPRSRSRSWSRDRARRYESDSRGSTPIQDHGDKDYRVPAANGAAIPPANSNPPLLGPHPDARDQWARDRPPPRPRCRDYDEKGFCMRGDLCPFDHGNDPVVVEDVNLPNVLAFPQGPGPGPGPIPPHHGPPPMHGPPGPPRGPPGPPHGPPRVPPGPPRGPPGPQRGPPGQSHGPPMPPRHTRPPAQSGPIPHRPHSPHRDSYNPEPYNPEAPQMRNHNQQYWGGSQRAPRTTGPPFQQHSQRALVSVPTVPEDPPLRDSQDASSFSRGGRGRGSRGRGFHGNQMGSNRTVIASKRPYEDTQDAGEKVAQIKPNPDRRLFPSSSEQPPQKRPGFDFSRLGPKRGNYNSENTTLEVRKIPKEMNNITKLNEHFSKFGHIINLQTCFGGDFEAALVTFLTNAQANAAYRSSEPVFNNRFIKVFWHKDKVPEGETSPQKPTQSTGESNTTEDKRIAVRDRVGNIPPPHKLQLNNTLKGSTHEKSVVVSPTGQLTKTVFNPAAVKSLPPAAHVSQILAASDKKKQEQKLQDAMKRKIEIQKQKQQLLQKYIQQQKLLIEKIEKNKTMGPDDKRLVMKTIKMLADNIEKLKKELTSGSTTPTVSPTGPKTKQQTQKEILDAELDIMMKTNEGVDTSQLKRRVALLKQEAEALGLTSSTSRGRGRGRGRGTTWSRGGRRRKLSASQLTVDRRPKQLLVTGFDAEAKDELSAHFSNLAEVEKVEIDDHIPNAIVTFKTRSDAEQVVSYGQVFKGKKMVLGWYSPQAAAASQAVKSPVSLDAPVPVSAVPPASNKVLVDQLETITVTVDTGMVEEEPSLDVEDQDQELNDLDEDLLLGVDDEDEDEEEGRSWRR